MKRYSIYDQGSSDRVEDGLVFGVNTIGVLDGVSAPYGPSYPRAEYDGLTGGELVVRTTEGAILGNSWRSFSLLDDVSLANGMVRDWFHANYHFSFDSLQDAGCLPGATFAFGKIIDSKLEVVQAGDCFAIIEKKDGDIFVSANQVRRHDVEMNGRIKQIQREVAKELLNCALENVPEDKRGKVRGEMWDRFCLELGTARRMDVNNKESRRGYGLLNGQRRLEEMLCAKVFPLDEITTAIFVTDGLIPWSVMESSKDSEIGVAIMEAYHRGGLAGMLLAARGEEKKMEATHYTNQAEATGVVLDFTK